MPQSLLQWDITYLSPEMLLLRKLINRNFKSVALENLLLETDSPFMTPVPYRGQRNEPSYIPLIAETIAEVQNVSIVDVSRITNYNVYRLYGIGEKAKVSFTYKIGNSLYINVTNRCNADCVFAIEKVKP